MLSLHGEKNHGQLNNKAAKWNDYCFPNNISANVIQYIGILRVKLIPRKVLEVKQNGH